MAVTAFPWPTDVPGAVSGGYGRQNTNFKATIAGHINIQVDNIDTGGVPAIAAGSVLEVNGGIYRVTTIVENITGSLTNNAVNYIYATPSGSGDQSTLYFQYLTTTPTWSAAKGGWYSGSSGNRAIVKLFYTGGNYNNKVILDSFNAIMFINTKQTIPTTGGALVDSGTINAPKVVELTRGMYYFTIKGGKGGTGGDSASGSAGHEGGAGADGEIVTKGFFVFSNKSVVLSAGGDGNNGTKPGYITNSGEVNGGGGGASGGLSYIILDITEFYLAIGGSGGGGGAGGGSNFNGAGGGGAGGYGTGADGVSDGTGAIPGLGGHNGIGGNSQGTFNRNGGGGSGYISGGNGSGNINNGGGYGEPGGGVNGGASFKKGELTMSDSGLKTAVFSFYNANQGGGQGGRIDTTPGPVPLGGSGLKSTSSGYARIYRVG
jgi:hypothetical protein